MSVDGPGGHPKASWWLERGTCAQRVQVPRGEGRFSFSSARREPCEPTSACSEGVRREGRAPATTAEAERPTTQRN